MRVSGIEVNIWGGLFGSELRQAADDNVGSSKLWGYSPSWPPAFRLFSELVVAHEDTAEGEDYEELLFIHGILFISEAVVLRFGWHLVANWCLIDVVNRTRKQMLFLIEDDYNSFYSAAKKKNYLRSNVKITMILDVLFSLSVSALFGQILPTCCTYIINVLNSSFCQPTA